MDKAVIPSCHGTNIKAFAYKYSKGTITHGYCCSNIRDITTLKQNSVKKR